MHINSLATGLRGVAHIPAARHCSSSVSVDLCRIESNALASCSGRQLPQARFGSRPAVQRNFTVAGALPVRTLDSWVPRHPVATIAALHHVNSHLFGAGSACDTILLE